jgi:hypothetical protein
MPARRLQAVDLFDDLRQRAHMGWPIRRPLREAALSRSGDRSRLVSSQCPDFCTELE